jgi:hypothetical protein
MLLDAGIEPAPSGRHHRLRLLHRRDRVTAQALRPVFHRPWQPSGSGSPAARPIPEPFTPRQRRRACVARRRSAGSPSSSSRARDAGLASAHRG